MEPEELGLTRVLFQSATLLAQFMVFGSHPLVIRYFDPKNKLLEKALERSSWMIVGLGVLITTLGLVVFNEPFIGYYSDKSNLFVEFAVWTLPMAIGLAIYQLLAAWAQVRGRSVIETGIKEVGLRFLFTLGISSYLFDWVNFTFLVEYYALTPLLAALSLGIFTYRKVNSGRSLDGVKAVSFRDFFRFAAYNLLSRASNFITLTIDVLLIGALVGLEAVAVYSIATYLVSFTAIPNRAVQKVAFPRVALWWLENDRSSIGRLYQDTSTGLLFWGGILFVGFYLASPAFVLFLGEEYEMIGIVFAVFGLGRMIEMITSINRGIIRNSPVYKYETYFSILFMVVMIGLDLLLIPLFEQRNPGSGIVGAAWGSALSFLIFNGLVSYVLYRRYSFSPFKKPQIVIVLWLSASFVLFPYMVLFERELWNVGMRLLGFGITVGLSLGYAHNKKANHNWLALK